MIILDNTAKSLEIKLDGAVTTNELPFVASFVDHTTSTFTPGENDGVSNGTTAVTVIAAPAASTQRQLKYLSVFNADTVAANVVIQYNNNGTIREILTVTLSVGSALVYNDDVGLRVLNSNGELLQAATVTSIGINEISDVVISGPADNEVLAFDSGSGNWINQTPVEANLVDLSTAQTLTNKTLTSPTINGTVATTGLTMPTFASGQINVTSGGYQIGGSTVIDSSENLTLAGTGRIDGGIVGVGNTNSFNSAATRIQFRSAAQTPRALIQANHTTLGDIRIESEGNQPIMLAGGNVEIHANVEIDATRKLFLDGGGDTAIWEVSANTIRNQAGGSGGVDLTSGASSWSAVSDERLKTIVEPISDGLSKVNSLRPVIGRYKDDDPSRRRSFLIAQDVQEVLPEAVHRGHDGYLYLSYTDTIPLLVAAAQEQSAVVQDLVARNAALERRVEALEAA